MHKCVMLFLSCLTTLCIHAQRITPEQYIDQFREIAISEMKRSGVPAAITLAQGLLETESGNSELVKKSNNHFGIKCKSTWTGASVTHDDDLSGECFRAYQTAEESFRDHSDFLRGNTRYASLFSLAADDYRSWARGLKKAGYATNPRYPDILIKNIEQYNLQQYTIQALSSMPGFDPAKYGIDSLRVVNIDSALINKNDSSTENPGGGLFEVITINNCKCIYAKKGTSLLALATKNKVNLNKLLEYNEMAKDGILANDQLVFLQKKSKTGETDFYKVQPAETLYDIAQKNGIQLQYLADYNRLKPGEALQPSMVLALKPGVKLPAPQQNESATEKFHTVVAKEGLYSIAKKYNVTMQQLREWNKLSTDALQIGQKLKVSQ